MLTLWLEADVGELFAHISSMIGKIYDRLSLAELQRLFYPALAISKSNAIAPSVFGFIKSEIRSLCQGPNLSAVCNTATPMLTVMRVPESRIGTGISSSASRSLSAMRFAVGHHCTAASAPSSQKYLFV